MVTMKQRTVRQRRRITPTTQPVDLSPIPGPALRYLMLIKEQRDEINERVGRTRNRPGVDDAAVRRDTIEQGGAGNGRSEQRQNGDTNPGTGRGVRDQGQRRTRTVRQRGR